MRLLFGHDRSVADFVSDGLGIVISPPFVAIGIVDDDKLRGGMVFDGYNGSNIEITLYAPGSLKRGIIRGGLHYVFVQSGVLRLSARTKRSNKAMCRILPRLGFKFEAVLPQYFGPQRGDDAVLYRMTREDAARWIG